jgi:hypothetical protein
MARAAMCTVPLALRRLWPASKLVEVDLEVVVLHRAGVRADKSVLQASKSIATCIHSRQAGNELAIIS